MTSLHLKKQICMGGGYMLDSSNMLFGVLGLIGGMFGMMLSFYIILSLIQWISDVIDEKRWEIWMEWFRYDS